MLKFAILGSGSKGNSCYIGSETEGFLLDAGFSGKKTFERLDHCGIAPSAIKGIVISHEHNDHIGGAGVLARKLDVPIFASGKSFENTEHRLGRVSDKVVIENGKPFEVGKIGVHPFTVSHDAGDPSAFVFRTGKGTSMAHITDLGTAGVLVKARLKEIDYIVLESNHDYEMLMAGPYTWELKQRIRSREGHLANEQCIELLKESLHSRLQGVTFAHLSEQNNNPDIVRLLARQLLNGTVPFQVAEQDMPCPVINVE